MIGIIQRGGEVVIRLLENVKQQTIKPIIEQHVDGMTYTEEYDIDDRLDEDSDGFYEIHVNIMEGFWSWRPHRGISQENLSGYVGAVLN